MRNERRSPGARPAAARPVEVPAGRGAHRRRFLAGLRDAHASAALRAAALRRLAGSPGLGTACARLLDEVGAEAEEQLRRLEHVFASLREQTGGGQAGAGAELAALAKASGDGREGQPAEAAVLQALQRDAEWGAEEHETLQQQAHEAGFYLAARLLDLTVQECWARARSLARRAGAPAGAPPRQARGAVH
jgi:ferritin-like metal-binding protein YciE